MLRKVGDVASGWSGVELTELWEDDKLIGIAGAMVELISFERRELFG